MNLTAPPLLAGSLFALLLAPSQATAVLPDSPFAGRWDPVVRVGEPEVPFPLEIVTLSFEGDDQLEDPRRLRAFIKAYGIDYTVLLAGEPGEADEKIPQAVGLDAFPNTFLLGRQGRVRAVHAGFPSPGSGPFYIQAKGEITSTVERLLSESF